MRSQTQLLLHYLRPYKRRLLLLLILLLTGISLQLLAPQLIRTFLDMAQTNAAVSQLTTTAVLFLLVTISQKVITLGTVYVGEDLGWATTNQLRTDLAEHCLRLDMPFHKMRTPGELIERIDGDVSNLSEFFAQLIIQIVGNGLLALGIILLLFREDWRVGLIGIAYALLVLSFLRLIQNRVIRFWQDVRQAFAEMFGFIEERLVGLEDIRANGAESYVMQRLYPLLNTVLRTRVRAEVMGSSTFVVGFFIYATSVVATLALGATSYLQGVMSIGTVYLLVSYINLLEGPLNIIRRQIDHLQRALASIGRIQQLFQVQPTLRQTVTAHLPHTAPAVQFAGVSFGYQDNLHLSNGQLANEAQVLHDISFNLPAGKVLGVLGRTGSGKTTLTRLLFRLYDVDAGLIQLDQVDVQSVALSDLRQRVGMVTQDVQIFAATVRDNLTLFKNYHQANPISDQDILTAIEMLGLGDWYQTLPDGLDTVLVGGGKGLSAGEAQLLAFTRVFLRDPALVILDEASSRLDPATEQLLERAIDRLLQDRTGIIIAHRLSTVQRADEILILDNGRIQEYGSRHDLVNDPHSRFSHLLQTGLQEVLV